MAKGKLQRKDLAIGGVATLFMLVSAYAGVVSVQTLFCFRDWLSMCFAVAVGLAVPAHLAWQTRRMVAGMAMTNLQGGMNAVSAVCDLAEQAHHALFGRLQTEYYCTAVFNQSQISHAIRRVDQIDLSLLPNSACKSAVDSARANLHCFFRILQDVVSEFNDIGRIPEDGVLAIHRAYELCVRNTQMVYCEWAILNHSNCGNWISPSENP